MKKFAIAFIVSIAFSFGLMACGDSDIDTPPPIIDLSGCEVLCDGSPDCPTSCNDL